MTTERLQEMAQKKTTSIDFVKNHPRFYQTHSQYTLLDSTSHHIFALQFCEDEKYNKGLYKDYERLYRF